MKMPGTGLQYLFKKYKEGEGPRQTGLGAGYGTD